jgi:hypothetical protein
MVPFPSRFLKILTGKTEGHNTVKGIILKELILTWPLRETDIAVFEMRREWLRKRFFIFLQAPYIVTMRIREGGSKPHDNADFTSGRCASGVAAVR